MEKETNQDNKEKKSGGKRQNVILTVVAVIIMIGVGFWYYSYIEGQKYFSTDNAKVLADVYPVIPQSAGKLERYSVKVGSYVEEDEIIGRVEDGGPLHSPINGVVIQSNGIINQTVSPAEPVAVIADADTVYIGANVEETDIRKIREGQSVTVQLDAYPGEKFNAYVSEVDMTTLNALSGAVTTFSTSGTYTKTTQLIPIKIMLTDDIDLEKIIGTNATVRIRLKD